MQEILLQLNKVRADVDLYQGYIKPIGALPENKIIE